MKLSSLGLIGIGLLIFWTRPVNAQQPQEQPQAPPPGPPGRQAPAPPPLPPRPPEVMMADEGKISIGPSGWFPTGHPVFDKGKTSASTTDSKVTFQGKDSFSRGLNLTLPGGGHNKIVVSYFDTKAAGGFTAATDLTLFDQGFTAGENVQTHYNLKSGKFSYQFVTWPYPVGSRHFRFKTLWEVQVVKFNQVFNDPTSEEIKLGAGSKTVILPTLGVGITEYVSRTFRVEVNASGFTLPHRAAIGDVEAFMAYRFARFELRGGAKMYYFKTSPQSDFYAKGRLTGGFIGLRAYLN